jgi:3-keto-5-aminohexanoate cleavage enzyme
MKASWDTYRWIAEAREGFGPVIVTCAVNGGVQGKESHEALPETPEEIAAQAGEAYDAGASIVHIHARGPEDWSESSSDPEIYRRVNALVRERCPDVIINNTTGGGPTLTMEARSACLDVGPEMASLNLGPDMSRFRIPERPEPLPSAHTAAECDVCIPFTYGIIESLAGQMQELGTRPELELYQPGQFWVVRELIERGSITPPYVHQFVMGYQTSVFPTPDHVWRLMLELPEESMFFVCGIGPYQLPLTTFAMLAGGNVRVGLEDNLYYARGRRFRGNGEAVERAVRIAGELNRDVATPAQAREMLGLSAEPRSYRTEERAGA